MLPQKWWKWLENERNLELISDLAIGASVLILLALLLF